MNHSATYDPGDNKLRLYPAHRLDPEDYKAARAAGFAWAPKQGIFVAPMWTPEREDFLLSQVDEIEDEDKSLVDRAEERAERFEEYSEKRLSDAERARQGVSAIADGIPLGQPILVGHHSERHARKDAERIENGMRKAVKMWETSKYWTARAVGALRHAKYKERSDVRARRIKGLEADKRKRERDLTVAEKSLSIWSNPELTHAEALRVSGMTEFGGFNMPRKEGDRPDFDQSPSAYTVLDGSYPNLYTHRPLEEVVTVALKTFPARIAYYKRWINHLENRLLYEKAMLEEAGGSQLLEKKKLPTKLPLCNYRSPTGTITVTNKWRRGESITSKQVEMTSEEYAKIHSDYKGTAICEGSHRVREAVRGGALVFVFLTDSKVHEKPSPAAPKELRLPEPVMPRPFKPTSRTDFDDIKDALKTGVQVVSAPQLFPTPAPLADRMAEELALKPGMTVLEPSAGTGGLVKALRGRYGSSGVLTAVEINLPLCDRLRGMGLDDVRQADFLTVPATSTFDRVMMNPPFENGADIKHILHAYGFLANGGRMVAICANGPRQQAALKPWVEEQEGTWEDLPEGTFTSSGTNVNTALIVIDK